MNNSSQREFLSLVINYPSFLETTYVKEEYFDNENKIIFSIISQEYQKHKTLILENLTRYKDFDVSYYAELMCSNIYDSSKDSAFIQLQKNIIDNYKKTESKKIIEEYKDNYEKLLVKLNNLNDINYNEIEYITANDMFHELNKNNKKVQTGFSILDMNLNISEHDLVILAGSTGGGKTTFALNLLNKMSKKYPCYYFNMEMGKNILYKRLVAIETGIELKYLNNFSTLNLEQKTKIKNALESIEERKIVLINKSQNISDIKKQVANIKNDKHTIIFLDHIGLIKSSGNSLYEKMTNVAKELRSICLDYNCTIIGLCQLSRESQKNNDEPKLQDLRDSGEIEQSARKVILLYNTTNDPQIRSHDIKLIIAKNDDGSKAKLNYRFDRFIQTFNEKYN